MDLQKMRPIMIKWGVIKGIITSLIGVMAFYIIGNLGLSALSTLVSLAAPILILIFAYKEYKSINEGFMTLKEALAIGLGIYLIEYVISMAWTLLYNNVINPGAQEEAMDKAMDQMEASPGMSDGFLDAFSSLTGEQSIGEQILYGLLASIAFWLFWSLIMGLIMKNDPQ